MRRARGNLSHDITPPTDRSSDALLNLGWPGGVGRPGKSDFQSSAASALHAIAGLVGQG
jgi:hypothetical protein